MKIEQSSHDVNTLPNLHWKARLIVSLIMLALGFIGLILTSIKSIASFQTWYYWLAMGPIFAILTIWLSWHLRRQDLKQKSLSLWHDCLHWAGLIGAVLIIHIFILSGILGRFEAGFVVLALLSFSCFTSGIYFERTLIFVGITLALMAILVSLLTQYIAVILMVVLAVAALLIFIKVRHFHAS